MSGDLEEREPDLVTRYMSKLRALEELASELNDIEEHEMDRGTKLNIIPDDNENNTQSQHDSDSSILISSPIIQIDGNTNFPNSPTRSYE